VSRVTQADVEHLLAAARAARSRAYAPYSGYAVGAAILTKGGALFAGCNVENATFGATICAERSAIAAMVAAGERAPIACVVVTAGPKAGSPCGICRQVLAEFARDMKVVLVAEDPHGRVIARSTQSLAALLPLAFRLRPAHGAGAAGKRGAHRA
jgi:cytidine deaminase